jgi:hypothetical protein
MVYSTKMIKNLYLFFYFVGWLNTGRNWLTSWPKSAQFFCPLRGGGKITYFRSEKGRFLPVMSPVSGAK